MSVNAKMTAIADAIRGKTGGTDPLTLVEMVAAIEGIETGGGGDPSYSGESGAAYIDRITIGPNTVTNATGMHTFFNEVARGDILLGFVLAGAYTVNNQAVFCALNTSGQVNYYRYKNGALSTGVYNNAAYDAILVEGTEYVVLSATKPVV